MKALKIFSVTVLTVGIIFLVVTRFRTEIINIISYSECGTPISYKLGSLDPKFGLTQESVTTTIQDATDIWSKTYGKPLFINSPEATLTVNFVYDERSALNTQIDQEQNELDQKDGTLREQINSYETDLSAYEKKLNALNARVEQVNSSGGAKPDEYNELVSQQNEIITEGNSLNERADKLNLTTNNFNSKVENLNQNVNQFNRAIAQKPEEGLYNGNDNTIIIYFANNHQELVRTLAHEFGHALGMLHTVDEQSIMYPNTTNFLEVRAQDKNELDDVCRKQLIPVLWMKRIAIWLHATVSSYIQN
jgi:hypothetical protein